MKTKTLKFIKNKSKYISILKSRICHFKSEAGTSLGFGVDQWDDKLNIY